MKNSKKLTNIQKLGAAFIVLSVLRLFPIADHKVIDDILGLLMALGLLLLYAGPSIKKKWRKFFSPSRAFSVLFFTCSLSFANAQTSNGDYTQQINTLKESFAKKSIDALKTYISPSLKFGPIPAQNTPAILTNVVSNFPKLNSLEILESKVGEAQVKFDFVGLGVNESTILFDEDGKISKIEFIENIILEEIKAQQALAKSVQKPSPGQLAEKYPYQKVEFASEDGLLISGNLYEIDPNKPVILLCHQAGYNKFEYADIAPKLNELGFNCLAIDQRSGGTFAEQTNETFNRATQKGIKDISYLDAEQDIVAAVKYLNQKFNKPVTVWGSSYSSSLALFASKDQDIINAVIAFSPGNYFGDQKPALEQVLQDLEKPFLITSSKKEAATIQEILKDLKLQANQLQFIPEGEGFHGSRALWEGQKGAEEYWQAVKNFLQMVYANK